MRSAGSNRTSACPLVTCCSQQSNLKSNKRLLDHCSIRGPVHNVLQQKPTEVTQVVLWWLGRYKTVRHVSKHDAHEGHDGAVDHGHHRPADEQHNIPAVCKSELRRKQQKSAGQRRLWRSTWKQNQATIVGAQRGTGGGLAKKKHTGGNPALPSSLTHTHTQLQYHAFVCIYSLLVHCGRFLWAW